MTIEALMVIPAVVTPRTVTGRDEDNDDIVTDGSPFTTTCWRARVSGTENQPDNVVVGDWHFYLPADTDLTKLNAQAKVTVDGEVFEMVVEPWLARNPRGVNGEHVEAYGRSSA